MNEAIRVRTAMNNISVVAMRFHHLVQNSLMPPLNNESQHRSNRTYR